ncbi:MAG: energy-coupling factor ABC transporter ATP-binding protein [Candidatus Cloacimonetes bacterium]|nr:energy-coupling factor ABC transporter ATP-binding protein [Candidatus Cloacimonadota bacterium]
MSLLSVVQLAFRYNAQDNWLFSGLDFCLEPGEILAVSGKSGCGKTTLLYLLNGIIPRHIDGEMKGDIKIAGIEHNKLSLPELAPHISMVMQNPHQQLFFPTVEQELAFAPENLCLSPDIIEERISNALQLLKISELRQQETATLSYGQQKLTALAAIYTLQPQILLLDEISNGISTEKKSHIINLIKSYAHSGKNIIIADHDPAFLDLASYRLSL